VLCLEIFCNEGKQTVMALTGPFLLISRHDYRSKRKANVHFIAREFSLIGQTRFFSSWFSLLSRVTKDQRLPLWNRANRVELVNGVETFLWKTLLHPSKVPAFLQPVMDSWFKAYVSHAPDTLHKWIAESNSIFLESGGPEIFFDLVKQINPDAKVIYICSDALGAIGCSNYVTRQLARIAPMLDGIRVPSKILASEFPVRGKVYFVPHGMDQDSFNTAGPSPYDGGINIVSVGDMLFDPGFFTLAAEAFPNINFHVIGGGEKSKTLAGSNIIVYGEMPFKDTLPYLKYAAAGVAPYMGDKVQPYLADTSMKLMQYGCLGLPAICPTIVAGDHVGRFGYIPGDRGSIKTAIESALLNGCFKGKQVTSWAGVAERLLSREAFPDTKL